MTQVSSKKILVAEDDPGIADLIKLVLEKGGYSVKICNDGNQVEQEARVFLPDLIISDLWLPGIDGAKLAKRLKSNKDTKLIPIVLVSAQDKLPEVMKKVKADGFLPKPFDLSDLIATVKKFTE